MTDSIATLKAAQCKCATPKSKQGFTMQNLLDALKAGLGVRKISWNDGFFVYMKDGSLFGGNLNNPCRDDKPYTETLGLEQDLSRYEIVDRPYILRRHLLKRVAELHNINNAKEIERAAKALKLDVGSYGC